ncbi:hypothetical protein PCANC_13742 [Puccinia coronata f. sp. avenae]|uniref:Uncharacterized protein n=1 Tax=Puccinia coronata f. sp. avenae TaxID=200324 RepID=A0A2N5VFN1_9BASI|nr:hypothetical protein PCANC_13742 [Puccinia coronata f. sp. avenae]
MGLSDSEGEAVVCMILNDTALHRSPTPPPLQQQATARRYSSPKRFSSREWHSAAKVSEHQRMHHALPTPSACSPSLASHALMSTTGANATGQSEPSPEATGEPLRTDSPSDTCYSYPASQENTPPSDVFSVVNHSRNHSPSNHSSNSDTGQSDAQEIALVARPFRGLAIMHCVWLPAEPIVITSSPPASQGPGGPQPISHDLNDGPDIMWDSGVLRMDWSQMVTHAMIWIMAKNPRAGERIREVFDHGEVTWQGVIAHHPKYDKSCEAWIVGNETWAAFSLAAIDSGKHGQNSALWCISLEPTAQPLIQVRAPPRRAVRPESPEIMVMVPVVPPGHTGGDRVFSPEITIMIPCDPAAPHEIPRALALTLEDFLDLSGIGQEDMATRRRMISLDVSHWTYFRFANEQQLQAVGFEEATAHLICGGVRKALARGSQASITIN